MPNRASRLAWDGAEQRSAPSGLTRAAIVRAAIAIADEEGLDAVSIRRVAARLEARPMSLYTYIASKEDLLELMANEIVAEVVVAGELPGDWRDALRLIARRSHAAFVAHPWVLELSGRRRHLGHSAVRHAEQLLTAIEPLGLAVEDAWTVVYIVGDYTLGHALRVAHATREPNVQYPKFEPSAFPRLAQALEAGGQQRGEATFDAGLEAVLDGIERRFAGGPRARRSERGPASHPETATSRRRDGE